MAAARGQARNFDVVVLGCGFYGRLTLRTLLDLGAGRHRVGVAGRSAVHLRASLAALGLDEEQVGIVAPVDAADYVAMKLLAAETRVLLACLPNYRAVGDAVVRACAEEGTHYFDLSVETDMHREWRLLYGEAAAASGCVIAPCCGYDFVIADFGAMEAARLFPQAAVLQTIECFMTVKTGPRGLVLREQTFLDLLDRLALPRAARAKALAGATGPTPPQPQLQQQPPQQPASLLARLAAALPLRYDHALGTLSLPGPKAEVDVVHLSRDQICQPGCSGAGCQYISRVTVPSLGMAALFSAGMGLLLLAKLPLISWMLRHAGPPLLRRLGVLTRDEAIYEEVMRAVTINKVFVARGRVAAPLTGSGGTGSGAGSSSRGQQPAAGEEVERTLTVTASGLAVTPAALALAAHTVLTEWQQIRVAGFTTSAAAFHATSYWDRLQERCQLAVEEGALPPAGAPEAHDTKED